MNVYIAAATHAHATDRAWKSEKAKHGIRNTNACHEWLKF